MKTLAFNLFPSEQLNAHNVIILHGLFGDKDNWRQVAKDLSQNYHCYTLDMRNHGDSFHTNSMSYHSMAEDVRQWMDENQIKSAHIIGHSMGGKTGMRLSSDHPNYVDSLIVIDIAPKVYPAQHDEIIQGLLAIDKANITERSQAKEILTKHITDQRIVGFLGKSLSKSETGLWKLKINIQAIQSDYNQVAANPLSQADAYEGPALFIRGGGSDYILDSDTSNIQLLFPNSVIKCIGKASHWVHADAYRETLDLIAEFLSHQ